MFNYIQYDKHQKNCHTLGISTVYKYRNNLNIKEKRDIRELDFGPTLNILKEEYLDLYDVYDIFAENSDLSTKYLGKSYRSKNDKLKAKKVLSNLRARVYIRKTVRWNRMSIIVRHRSK